MAKNSIREYSATAGSNTDVGGIAIVGTAPVANFDDALRTVMKHLADMNAGTSTISATFTLSDPADATKKARFDCVGITTATTRTYTLPDVNGTMLTDQTIGSTVQAYSASLAAFSTAGSAGTVTTRTTRLNLPTSGGGTFYAFGRNGSNAGADYNGLMIGGGLAADGTDGTYLAPDEHASWMRAQPSKNYSPIEALFYATAAQGLASKVNGTNQLTVTSGSTPNSTWVGEKIYWESETYLVSGVSGSTITVTTTGGGGVTFSGTASGVWHVFYVEGTGLCNVSGTTVTRVSGDPFIPFFSAPFKMKINGSSVTVNSFTDNSTIGLSSAPGNGSNLAYVWRTDIDDTMVQARLQKVIGDDEENITLGVKSWGYFIRSQVAGSGVHRPVYLAAGDNKAQISLMTDGKIRLGDHGRIITPGTGTYNYVEFDSATTGLSPSFRVRGVDSNIGLGFDMLGTGAFVITKDAFATTLLNLDSNGLLTPVGIRTSVLLGNYANDAAAAVGGVVVGQFYRNGNVVQQRLS